MTIFKMTGNRAALLPLQDGVCKVILIGKSRLSFWALACCFYPCWGRAETYRIVCRKPAAHVQIHQTKYFRNVISKVFRMKCLWRSARQIEFQWFLLCLVCRLLFWVFATLQVLCIQAGAASLCVWWAVGSWTSPGISSDAEWSSSYRKEGYPMIRYGLVFF